MKRDDFLKLRKSSLLDKVKNDNNYLKIFFIQILLNLNKNFKFFNIVFLLFLFFISASIFGFWNLFSGYYHV